jgi:feruloyl-CoA synthase
MSTKAAAADELFSAPRIVCEPRPDGAVIIRSLEPLGPYERNVADMLRRWAADTPTRTFMTERRPDGSRRTITYGQALGQAQSVAQALIDRGMESDHAVMVLSGNSIDHALLTLAAHLAGVPVVPVSPAYSQMSTDFSKLRHVAGLVRPRLVFVTELTPFAAALAIPELDGVEVVASRGAGGDVRVRTRSFSELVETPVTAAVEARRRTIEPDAVAKVLFTSGSTDLPKGVLNTHRMLCSNQQAIAQVWPFCSGTPPVLVDWLPWNHTFGANHNLNLVLKHGGTLHIDEGKPVPGLIEATVANLRELSPTVYFNVPVGFAQLLPYLEQDAELRESFFRRLGLIFYAGAALSQDLWERLDAVAIRQTGATVAMTSSWGLTETSPLATAAHFPVDRAGLIGVPVPGVEVKLVPTEGGKTEPRVRGPNVTPGYLGRPDLAIAAFDDDGFYRTGDAGKLVDPENPNRGLVFDGRTVEDFKLSTGTFVSVGQLRSSVLAAVEGLLQDVVVCGHDRNEIGLLAWAAPAHVDDLALRELLQTRLERRNAEQPGSSRQVARLLLLATPASLDAGEITDKGYVNQRSVLRLRAKDVQRLYAEPLDPEVVNLRW